MPNLAHFVKHQVLSPSGFIGIVMATLLGCGAVLPAQVQETRKPDLYYLVVDMSGSIPMYGLEQPVKDEVARFIRGLPDRAVVKVRLFDHEIRPEWKREVGDRITPLVREDLVRWFSQTYAPRRGDTFLFDVTGKALREIAEERETFDSVRLIILSDGINDTGGKPSEFPTWASLGGLMEGIQLDKRISQVFWLYMEARTEEGRRHQAEAGNPIEPIVKLEGDVTNIIDKAIRPEADFGAHPGRVSPGQEVKFFLTKEVAVDSLEWTFSDGQRSTDRAPMLSFQKPGMITATLAVTGPGGTERFVKKDLIEVVENAPPPAPSADFTAHPTTITAGESVLFAPRSPLGADAFRWEFGDGNHSEETQPTHTYAKPGSYTVKLEVQGPGGKDSRTMPNLILVEEVRVDLAIAKFSAKPTKGRAPLTVRFKDESTGQIARYDWDFGDGNTSDLREPEHTYEKAGDYTVRLTVINTRGESSVSAEAILVKVLPPREPLPLWQKISLIIGAVLVFWLGLVKFVFNPLVGLVGLKDPSLKLRPKAGTGVPVGRLAAKFHLANLFWPKTSLRLGGAGSDIVLAGVSGEIGVIQRIPFQKACSLVLPTSGPPKVFLLQQKKDLLTGTTKVVESPITGVFPLQAGQEFKISNSVYVWGK